MREVNVAMKWILDNRRDCVKFKPDTACMKSIATYLEYNHSDGYITMTLSYGILFTLALLDYYVSIENYEKCAVLVQAIKECNVMYKTDLPTTLDSQWARENILLTPLQILHKHFHQNAK